ncbi:hypothetical protein [Companilactobacillus ginsenosidimutans]|uniref:Surface layer protein A domain-containing protein n=1 Tax=Companilactobacillus ginsenosidimutans TaxID=1007676 RepID=A0A0H4QFQ9_9LACO|nr:hypothetical protein [Companilactobacillus ginsenosidimutans]AKP67249.1 hypothetical protein ABM34_06650 [Companilactobacillus ginsenosidimutans]
MKKITKSLLISATVLLSLAPAATLATGATTAHAEDVYYDKAGHFEGPSINVTYNNDVQVQSGTGMYALTKINASDLGATSISDNQSIGATGYGDNKLYTTREGATYMRTADLTKDTSVQKDTTYYQRVYLKVNGLDTNNALLSMQIPYSPAKITFNGAEMNYTNYANGNGYFIIVRAVSGSDTPGQSSSNFYDIPTKGTVKVTSSTPARLYDEKGNAIGTRALGPNTNWFTDTQRVARDGQVFYRVSTSEYVAEKDAGFIPAAQTNTATSALAD